MLKETKDWQIFIVITMSVIAVLIPMWSYNGQWVTNPSTYNTYTIQAQAWLNGHIDIIDYSHLELAYYQDKAYVSFPPFPSVIMVPFVLIWKTQTPDGLINLLFSIIGIFYAYKLAKNFNYSVLLSLFLAFFISISTNVVFLMQNGWVWFFAQTLSFTFTIIAFYFATKKEPNFTLAFLFLAFAIGCRPFQMIYGGLLLFLAFKESKEIKSIFYYILPALFIGILYASYNYIRFDNFIEFGHNYLKEMTQSEHGQFSIVYLWDNLKTLFLIPDIGSNGVVNYPKFNGFSIFILNPILILVFILLSWYLIIHSKKELKGSGASHLPFISMLLGSIILHIMAISMHITMGGWHFGNRYLIDTLPAFFILLCLLDKETEGLRLFYIPFFLYGFAFNVLGSTLFYLT